MDIYEALEAENRNLEKAARKVLDATAGEPARREQLLREVIARLDAQETVQENHVHPILRVSVARRDLVDEFNARIKSIHDRIHELQELPNEADHNWQNSAEALSNEIDLLTHWERGEILPVIRETISDDEANMYGERIRAEQKDIIHQKL